MPDITNTFNWPTGPVIVHPDRVRCDATSYVPFVLLFVYRSDTTP